MIIYSYSQGINIILLSGGNGKCLWSPFNDVGRKQFIKLFKNGDEYKLIVQRVYRHITTTNPDAKITIAISKSQVSAIKNQLGGGGGRLSVRNHDAVIHSRSLLSQQLIFMMS